MNGLGFNSLVKDSILCFFGGDSFIKRIELEKINKFANETIIFKPDYVLKKIKPSIFKGVVITQNKKL